MALSENSCPSGYRWYTCAAPPFRGCCSVDPCSTGCPPGSEFLSTSTSTFILPSPSRPTTGVAQPTGSSGPTSRSSIPTSTDAPLAPTPETSGTSTQQSATASPTQQSAPASPTQQSVAVSPTQSNTKGSATSNPLLLIIAISIGGVLVIVIIVIAIILCRRRHRKRKNSAEGLPSHSSVSEPSPDDGPVTGFFALFKRTHPIPAETTTMLTSSPSTTCPELPSPSFPKPPQHSVVPGFAELPSPPMSSVSELSSGDRGIYSSTNVSTASTGAVVSPTPHETLRGGGRPAMMPNMVSRGREGRRHALSWQSLEPGDRN